MTVAQREAPIAQSVILADTALYDVRLSHMGTNGFVLSP
jgi:hypothetical protein